MQEIEAGGEVLQQLYALASTPVWKSWDFWVFIVVGVGGLYLSFRAFQEARAAKRAALDAGRTVKVQSVTIELSEVSQRLDAISQDITYTEARNLLAEITRKLRRVISPFSEDGGLSSAIESLKEALDAAQVALKSVRPSGGDGSEKAEAGAVVYYGVEGEFSNINNLVADLIGLLEKGVMSQDGAYT